MTGPEPEAPTRVRATPGAPCASCGSPLAADQRYCLNCGTRRAERRVPVEATGGPSGALGTGRRGPAPVAPGGGPVAVERLGGAWGVAALLLLALGVGVIIGNQGGDNASVAARPPEVTIDAGAVGATAGSPIANTTPPTDEWPDRDGFTVQLGELPKATTDQAAADAAKAAASAKGADAPGILDAGIHGLTDGQLVLYSGVFSKRKEATAALEDLKGAYPDARVVEVKATSSTSGAATAGDSPDDAAGSTPSKPATVSKSKLKETEKLSPEAFQKQSKKLPKTTALPGKPPPKDNAAPGGGSEAETIG